MLTLCRLSQFRGRIFVRAIGSGYTMQVSSTHAVNAYAQMWVWACRFPFAHLRSPPAESLRIPFPCREAPCCRLRRKEQRHTTCKDDCFVFLWSHHTHHLCDLDYKTCPHADERTHKRSLTGGEARRVSSWLLTSARIFKTWQHDSRKPGSCESTCAWRHTETHLKLQTIARQLDTADQKRDKRSVIYSDCHLCCSFVAHVFYTLFNSYWNPVLPNSMFLHFLHCQFEILSPFWKNKRKWNLFFLIRLID